MAVYEKRVGLVIALIECFAILPPQLHVRATKPLQLSIPLLKLTNSAFHYKTCYLVKHTSWLQLHLAASVRVCIKRAFHDQK